MVRVDGCGVCFRGFCGHVFIYLYVYILMYGLLMELYVCVCGCMYM